MFGHARVDSVNNSVGEEIDDLDGVVAITDSELIEAWNAECQPGPKWTCR